MPERPGPAAARPPGPRASPPTILIVGASARAAAASARRAGLHPVGFDLFGDQDLCILGRSAPIPPPQFPDALPALLVLEPPGPWFYTGAIENHPDLIDRLARERPLWGNAGSVVRAVRDPIAVAAVLAQAGIPHPEVRLDPTGLPRDGRWLVKAIASAGGLGIVPLDDRWCGAERPVYFQHRIEGASFSAIAISRPGAEAMLVGITRQWIGRPGAPFAYRGNVGPWPVADALRDRVERLMQLLASRFSLVGLFGVDCIEHDDWPWPVEVNPRYTASVEVFELALGRALLDEHRRACDPASTGLAVARPVLPRPAVVGKAIVFAESAGELPADLALAMPDPHDPFAVPEVADVPQPGIRFEQGDPVLTVFARGPSAEACEALLRERLAAWQRRLRPQGGSSSRVAR